MKNISLLGHGIFKDPFIFIAAFEISGGFCRICSLSTKISSAAGCSIGSVVEKGSSASRQEEPFFMASVIPAAFHPFAIIGPMALANRVL